MSSEDMSATMESFARSGAFAGMTVLPGDSLRATSVLRSIAGAAAAEFVLLYTKDHALEMGLFALDRILAVD